MMRLLTVLLLAGAAVAPAAEPPPGADALRRAGRAFEGAPPTIPHPYDSMDQAVCVGCHSTGEDPGFGRPAPITPHPHQVACLQCHVARAEESAPGPDPAPARLGMMPRVHRAFPGAPPVVPHKYSGRERCAACHAGPGTPADLRTSHPERIHCLQCHALDAARQGQP